MSIYWPQRVRWVSILMASATVILFTVLSFGLHGSTGDNGGQFQRGDQAAMIGLGVLAAAGILMFNRPRVWADEEQVRVRNLVSGIELPWSQVRAVRFNRDSAWAMLELHDDETVAVMALQAVDKDYAVEGVRRLRALHAAATQKV